MVVPKRILILGPNGAGKSTLARAIGKRIGIPVVHLDAIYWNPGWVVADRHQFREQVAERASQDDWVMDGNYTSHLDLRMPRAQAVIWLDLPRHVYFSRAVWRLIRNYGRERGDVGAGNRERFELSFFRDWVWTYPERSRSRHAELVDNLPEGICGIVLRSRAEVAMFLEDLPGSLDDRSINGPEPRQ